MKKTSGNWIDRAVKRPGALRKKARSSGKSTHAFAEEHKHDKGRTGAQSRLALALGKMRRGKKKTTKRVAKRTSRR